MRIVLVNPPSPPGVTINREGAAGLGNRYEHDGAFLYPPGTLATAAALLRMSGDEPVLVDATAERLSSKVTLERIGSVAPDVAVVLLSWSGWDDDLFFLEVLKATRPQLPVVAVGTVLREHARGEAAAAVADLVLVGEPELALPAACRAVHVASGGGDIVPAVELAPQNYDAAGFMRDVDALSMPAWDMVSTSRYPALTLLTSRGCAQACVYCPYVVGWGSRPRDCSPERVVRELLWLRREHSPARIMFRDPVFAHDRERVVAICERMGGEGLEWECETRPEHLDAELLRMMRKAGCRAVKIGLESADAGRLAALGRIASPADAGAYLDAVRQAVTTCRRLDMRCHVFAMVGFPGVTEQEMETTRAFLGELDVRHLSVKVLEAYPGCRLAAAGLSPDVRGADRHRGLLLSAAPPAPALRRPTWRRALSAVRASLGRVAR